MRLIVCLDDKNGMAFNHRRQSRDCVVTEDIRHFIEEKNTILWIAENSLCLFDNLSFVKVETNPIQAAKEGEYVFLETQSVDLTKYDWEMLIVYRWNRIYPADVYFTFPKDCKLIKSEEFAGYSHEKITKEIYGKKM